MSNYEEREQEQLAEIAAIVSMNAIIANNELYAKLMKQSGNDICIAVARLAVTHAQALSAELKKLKKPKAT